MVTLLALSSTCLAAIPGVNLYVANGDLVVLVRAQTNMEAAEYPAPEGEQFLLTEEVLKGVDTRQNFTVPAGNVPFGQRAVLVIQNSARDFSAQHAPPAPIIWPLDQKDVFTKDVSAGPAYSFPIEHATLADVRRCAARDRPQDVNLNREIIDWVLFPDLAVSIEKKNPRRAAYVGFVAAIFDLNRDVVALSQLLESPSAQIRSAAEERLRALTKAEIESTDSTFPKTLHAQAVKWQDWWNRNRPYLAWNPVSHSWEKRKLPAVEARRWWDVLEDHKTSPDEFPRELVSAVEQCDAHAFADAFAAWLDSGVRREHSMQLALQTDWAILKDKGLENFSPLSPDIILNTQLPTMVRMRQIFRGIPERARPP
jgi:hypothetical protein